MHNVYLSQYNNVSKLKKEKDTSCSITFSGTCCDSYAQYSKNYQKNNTQKDSFSAKYLSSPCAIYPGFFATLGIGINGLINIVKAESKVAARGAVWKMLKHSSIAILLGSLYSIAVSAYLNSKTDRNIANSKQYFDSINTTNARISNNPFASTYMGAFYQPATGEISINYNLVNDPWSRLKYKYLLRHELVHAKQFEMIARMDDGIEKLNYYVLKSEAENFKNNKLLKQDFDKMYEELMHEPAEKYANETMIISDRKVPLRDYVLTIHQLMNDEITDYHKLPILINSKHYTDVRTRRGALSPEEKQKAEEYFNAAINYKPVSLWSSLNPFSKYYNNLLEKEAYKENPWWTRII